MGPRSVRLWQTTGTGRMAHSEHPQLPAGWLDTQRCIAGQVNSSTDFIKPADLQFVAGADVTFSSIDPAFCVACLVVCAFPSLEPVAIRHKVLRIDVPYIPGFLGKT